MSKKHSLRPHPSYSMEQKLHAVGLVREQNLSIVQVCKNLTISKSALQSWLKQHDAASLPTSSITPEQQRIRELERRNK